MRFFETIGNAIVIAYDDGPVLTTDPWINGDAYFGSWGHDYEIAPAQMQAIRDAKYHWFSHGHPDHLNIQSLPLLTKGEFLVSDHYAAVSRGISSQRDLPCECCPIANGFRCQRESKFILSPTKTKIRCC
jgi:hypothetical protein